MSRSTLIRELHEGEVQVHRPTLGKQADGVRRPPFCRFCFGEWPCVSAVLDSIDLRYGDTDQIEVVADWRGEPLDTILVLDAAGSLQSLSSGAASKLFEEREAARDAALDTVHRLRRERQQAEVEAAGVLADALADKNRDVFINGEVVRKAVQPWTEGTVLR